MQKGSLKQIFAGAVIGLVAVTGLSVGKNVADHYMPQKIEQVEKDANIALPNEQLVIKLPKTVTDMSPRDVCWMASESNDLIGSVMPMIPKSERPACETALETTGSYTPNKVVISPALLKGIRPL